VLLQVPCAYMHNEDAEDAVEPDASVNPESGPLARERIRTVLAVLRTAVGNPDLRRLGFSYALCCTAELGIWIALLIYAYGRGGTAAGATIVLVQLIPCIVLGPFLGAVADVRDPQRVLIIGMVGQVVSMGAVAGAIEWGAPEWAVFTLAPVAALSITLTRPTQAALFPAVVRTPEELTAANVMSGWTYGVACLVGPALAGVLVVLGGTALAVAGCAALAGLAVIPGARLHVLRDYEPTDERAKTRLSAWRALDEFRRELQANLGTAATIPGVRLLLSLHAFYFVLVGTIDLLCVVIAASYLHMGAGGAGYLNAASGAGAVVAGFGTAFLIGRRRLKGPLVLTLAVAVIALALISATPRVAPVVALLVLVGLSGAIFDVTSRTLLQRSTPPYVVASLFSILESLMDTGMVLGVVLVRVAYAIGGLRAALIAPAALALVLVVAVWPRLRKLDDSTVVPLVEIRLLRAIPIFAALPAPELEGVAKELEPVPVRAGTTVFHEGDPGDRYYAVSSGSLYIVRQGELVQTVTRGQGFGEIALIRDIPRQATVTAESDTLLYSLDKELFVVTLTRHAGASTAARRIIEDHLGENN
jgi:MFS family permease